MDSIRASGPVRLLSAVALSAVSLTGCGLFDASEPEPVGCAPEYASVEQTASTALASYNLPGAALLVRVEGRTVCRLFFGAYGPGTRIATASAAKWLTAATLLAVVDRGELALDTPAGQLFPTAPSTTAGITLSQLLSHTSGLLWFSRCMGRVGYTLQECAEQILDGDQHFEPGAGFFYSGPPYTVAGAMAERALGTSWEELFRALIAGPLGMTGTTYGEGPNPALSEGEVFSTLDDYGRFVQLILDRGVRNGRRVLSEHAIQEMRRAWSNGVPVVSSPRGTIPYGLGAWLDEVDETGTGIVLSSPGIGGFVPLVDYRRELVFVFAAQDDIARIGPGISAILQQVRAVVDQGAP